MTTLPWSVLGDSRPLAPGDRRYVRRPWGSGDRIARLVISGMSPIAVTGPSGSGKSTELHRAALVLAENDLHPFLLEVDSLLSMEDPSPGLVVYVVAEAMLAKVVADNQDAVPSRQVVDDVRASDPRLSRGAGLRRDPADLLALVNLEVCRILGVPRVALLLDGLDRAPIAVARAAVQGFLAVRETLPIVVVVDPELTNGPASRDLLQRYRVFALPAIPVREGAASSEDGRAFLSSILAYRLGAEVPATVEPLVRRAAERSGGVVRTFMSLLADAAGYTAIEGGEGPTSAGLDEAIRDRADNVRRLLRDGDLDALASSDGTDGLEVDVDRRVRFLSAGLLLEYPAGEDTVVEPHPMLARLIINRSPEKARTKAAPARKPRARKKA